MNGDLLAFELVPDMGEDHAENTIFSGSKLIFCTLVLHKGPKCSKLAPKVTRGFSTCRVYVKLMRILRFLNGIFGKKW